MTADKKIILIGAGVGGQIALSFYGLARIHCFVDNHKYGQRLYGKDIISFNELKSIWTGYDIIITTNFAAAETLKSQCEEMNIKADVFGEKVTWRDYPSNPKIRDIKDLHKNERCFLIGNGPSLRIDDLDRLKGEISFGCNKIYRSYDDTDWRPDYYAASDTVFIEVDYKEIAAFGAKIKFIQNPEQILYGNNRDIVDTFEKAAGDTYFFNRIIASSREGVLSFSDDPSRAIYTSGTVMHTMLQLAVYMGFSQIYFLGVDNTFAVKSGETTYNGTASHFYSEKDEENDKYLHVHGKREARSSAELVNTWYAAAAKYLRERGVNVFNATRGGALDAFERVDFDSLLG